MEGLVILGIILIIYAILCIALVITKPEAVWKLGKFKMFVKVLGAKGTDIFITVWGLIVGGIGIYLLIR